MSYRMLSIPPFAAEYLHAFENDPPEWRPCQIIGIAPSDTLNLNTRPYFVGSAQHEGRTYPVEAVEVRRAPA